MVKKIKKQNKSKESHQIKKHLNLSLIANKLRLKLQSNKNNKIPKINTTILFQINSETFPKEEFEKEYNKRYLFYIKEEFNSKIITMFFNYISFTKIIPKSFKNNRYFLKEFLKIIINLLINEIDLVTMTLIFDNMGWIAEGTDPWKYIYYICLSSKEKSSSENAFSILTNILEKNNPGFIASYNNWKNNINNKKNLDKIDIIKTNERYKELLKPLYLNENEKKFINYNEIVNKIVSMSKQKEDINQINQINEKHVEIKKELWPQNFPQQSKLTLLDNASGLNPNNKFVSLSKQSQILDFQHTYSFYNDNILDLSRGGSKNNSFMGINSIVDGGELYKLPIMKFNNK